MGERQREGKEKEEENFIRVPQWRKTKRFPGT
jgi:hypothetical protein